MLKNEGMKSFVENAIENKKDTINSHSSDLGAYVVPTWLGSASSLVFPILPQGLRTDTKAAKMRIIIQTTPTIFIICKA